MDHAKQLVSASRSIREARVNRRTFTGGIAVSAAALALGNRFVGAQDASPAAGTTPDGVTVETVASGLNAPRYIAVDGDTVYFTESGKGGDSAVFATPAAGTPAAADPISQRGYSGKLSAIAADGTVTAIVEDFLSYTFGANGEIVGAAGLGLDGNGKAYVAVGAPGPNVSEIELTGDEDAIYEIDLATGEKKLLANTAPYEIENNPDPATVDSNLYGAAFADGKFYVADAGGNTVYVVDVATSELSVFDITGGVEAPFLGEAGNPLRGGAAEIDSVPGPVAVGPDGAIYVGLVTGGPFPAGLAPIYSYSPDGTRSVYASGLTMVGGLAFASDGTLYATLISSDFVTGAPGLLVRVGADGNHTVILDDLIVPAGIAFDADDTLYLANKSTGFTDGGEILKYTGITAVEGYAFAVPTADAGTAAATPEAAATDGSAVTVKLEDVAFDQTEITIAADTDVTFVFDNVGALPHDFVIDELSVNSGVVAPGGNASVVINAPAGTYTYYCSQVGHREAGMVGTLTVE